MTQHIGVWNCSSISQNVAGEKPARQGANVQMCGSFPKRYFNVNNCTEVRGLALMCGP